MWYESSADSAMGPDILAYSDWDENEATPHSCPTLCEV
jgi:hypothetical protein